VRDGRITLGQLLKLTGLVDRGSETRPFLAGGRVTVNGLPDRDGRPDARQHREPRCEQENRRGEREAGGARHDGRAKW